MSDEDKVQKHRTFLRNRQDASNSDFAYPITRSAKEIAKGKEPKEKTQRRGIWDTPVKISLRDYRKNRNQ